MAESIKGWRIALEGLLALSYRVVDAAKRQGMMAARQQACMLERRVRMIYMNMERYRPVSEGYETILLTLQDVAANMCRG